MKENSNEIECNSIEEDIEILEENIKSVKENADMAFFENNEDYYFFKAVEHILSDYKRVLKENETFKRQFKGQVIKIEEITKLNQELVNENKIQDRIINKICNYICCTDYESKIKLKEDDIEYYGELGSIRKYFEDKVRKEK